MSYVSDKDELEYSKSDQAWQIAKKKSSSALYLSLSAAYVTVLINKKKKKYLNRCMPWNRSLILAAAKPGLRRTSACGTTWTSRFQSQPPTLTCAAFCPICWRHLVFALRTKKSTPSSGSCPIVMRLTDARASLASSCRR